MAFQMLNPDTIIDVGEHPPLLAADAIWFEVRDDMVLCHVLRSLNPMSRTTLMARCAIMLFSVPDFAAMVHAAEAAIASAGEPLRSLVGGLTTH